MTTSPATDADETRRLCYMALLARYTEHHDLAGTLVNALRHHQGVKDPDLEKKVIDVLEGKHSAADNWIREQIKHLSEPA